MNQSLFIQYVLSFFPVLKTLIEKVNGKRGNQLTYLHKDTSILRRVYSPDNKWEADTVNLTYVAADYVADNKETIKNGVIRCIRRGFARCRPPPKQRITSQKEKFLLPVCYSKL